MLLSTYWQCLPKSNANTFTLTFLHHRHEFVVIYPAILKDQNDAKSVNNGNSINMNVPICMSKSLTWLCLTLNDNYNCRQWID